MGKITIVINDELEKRLRKRISERGYKKGILSIAVEEAIIDWLIKKESNS